MRPLLTLLGSLSNDGLQSLPSRSGLYFVVFNENVMYIGQTCNLYERWKRHHLVQRQLSCFDYNKASLLFMPMPLKEAKALEPQFIAELRPSWNMEFNEDFYRPTAELDFVAFCVSDIRAYGNIEQFTWTRENTYKGAIGGRIPLRKKSHAYGDIPAWLIPYETILEDLRLTWPFSHEEISETRHSLRDMSDDLLRERLERKYDSIIYAMESYGLELLEVA